MSRFRDTLMINVIGSVLVSLPVVLVSISLADISSAQEELLIL